MFVPAEAREREGVAWPRGGAGEIASGGARERRHEVETRRREVEPRCRGEGGNAGEKGSSPCGAMGMDEDGG